MLLRAQFTGPEFRTLLRFRTVSMTRPCPQLYFESTKIFVTRIQFLEVTGIFTGPAKTVAYPNAAAQETTFPANRIGLTARFRVQASELNANNDPVPFADKEGDVRIAVDVTVAGGNDQLAIEVLDTDFDTILSLAGVGKAEMSNLLAAGVFNLGLVKQINDITKALGDFAALRHVDAAYNPANDRVEIRIEVNAAGAPATAGWAQFYSNSFDDITAGASWGLLLDQAIGTTLMKRSITLEIDAHGSEFRREGEVNVYWKPEVPGYYASVEGEVIDACQCLWGEIDLDVRAWLDLNFSLNAGKLRTDLWFDHKITDVAEAACCVITSSVLFPIFGIVMLFNGQLKWYEFFGGVLLSPFPLVSLVAAIARFKTGVPLQFCIPDPSNENHFTCEFALAALKESAGCGGAEMSLTPERLSGRPDGLVLAGRLDSSRIVDPEIGVDQVSPLKYVPPVFGCSGGSSGDAFSSEFHLFRTSGTYDFHVCRVHVLGPFKYAAKVEITEMNCPYHAWVKVSIGFLQYDYSPIKVLVVTTAGAVHVTLPAAVHVSDQQRQDAILAAELKRISDCYAKSKRWDIRWLIDPEPFIGVIQTRQVWAINGIASQNSKQVAIVDEQGNSAATVNTQQGRAMRVNLLHAGRSLSVVQESDDERDLQTAGFQVTQTLMGVQRTMGFRTPVVAVDPVRMSPVRLVLVYERDLLSLYRVEDQHLVEYGTLDTSQAEWIGRQRGWLYAGVGDRVLSIDLEADPVRWRDTNPPSARTTHGDCGCSGMPARDAKARAIAAPSIPSNFTFLLRRGRHAEPGIFVDGTYWQHQWQDISVKAELHRSHWKAGRLHLHREGSEVFRINSETYLAISGKGMEIEILRTLKRLEL